MGCNTSKDAKQPGTQKQKGKQQQMSQSPDKLNQSPSKTGPKRNIKQIPEAELAKQKVSDILSFIKTGNLAMVEGLIHHHKLGIAVMLLSGLQDEFKLDAKEKISTADWNPLLLAIGYKKIEIVRYLTQDLHVSVRQWTRKPNTQLSLDNDAFIEQQLFAFTLVIANKDVAMLKELWNVNYIAWEEVHLQRLFQLLLHSKWQDGMRAFLQSYTTDILIATQNHEQQFASLRNILRNKKAGAAAAGASGAHVDKSSGDMWKIVDETFSKTPYLLPFLYVALTDDQELVSKPEIKNLIEKHANQITEFDYGLFKFRVAATQSLDTVLTAYETKGEVEKAQVAKIREHIAVLEGKIGQAKVVELQQDQQVPAPVQDQQPILDADGQVIQQEQQDVPVAIHVAKVQAVEPPSSSGILHFQSFEQFRQKSDDLFEAIRRADLDSIRKLYAELGLRQVPYIQAQNNLSTYQKINELDNYRYWPLTAALASDFTIDAEKRIEIYNYFKTNGFNVRQALCQVSEPGIVDARQNLVLPVNVSLQFLTALGDAQSALFRYLWGSDDYNNLYEVDHLQQLIQAFYANFNRLPNILEELDFALNNATALNLFLKLTVTQRYALISELYNLFYGSKEIQQILSSRHYAPYLLPILIERDTFMKTQEFQIFDQAVANCSVVELEQIAQSSDFDEKFLTFFRYVEILDASDLKKQHGQRLVDLIKNTQKFKAYLDQTLKILENESIVQEEEADEGHGGPALRLHQTHATNKLAERISHSIKDFSLQSIQDALVNGDQQRVIEILQIYKLSDLQFLRGSNNHVSQIYRLDENNRDFSEVSVPWSNLNILQIAVLNSQVDLVRFLIQDYKTFSHQYRQLKEIDQRFILHNPDSEDETLAIRLAIQNGNLQIFQDLWDRFGTLYTEKQAMTILRYILFHYRTNYLQSFLMSYSTHHAYVNMPPSTRLEFIQLLGTVQQDEQVSHIVHQFLQSEPYTRVENNFGDDVSQQIYTLICNNEVEQLEHILLNFNIQGIANINFDFFNEDEEVLNLADDQKITLSLLNPILLALKTKSFACLKFLVQRFGVRKCMKNLELSFKHEQVGEFPFKNIMMPILLKIKDVEALSFLCSKVKDFVITTQDLNSFISYALTDKWLLGLKTFLLSETCQFYFQSLTFDEQRLLVERIVKNINDLEEAASRKQYIQNIILECLTRRPYSKHLIVSLVEGQLRNHAEIAKIARECLKSLTSEDLMLLALNDYQSMADYERKYTNPLGEGFDSEVAKIMQRYAKEGRPEHLAPQYVESRKQVRFEEQEQIDNRI